VPSQFFGLNTAYTGLLNANAALNTTANNISNAETKGYSRQEVVSQASEALRVFTTYGCAGAGVDTIAIERIHDEFYDSKYWHNNTKTGEYQMKEYYMLQIEDYFKDDSTIEGFSKVFQQMMDALAEVKKNPASDSTKSQFVGFAGNLCEYFRSMASSMEQVQKDVNSEIKLKIDEINSLASEIATLNKQINVIELSGSKANELRDKRSLLLDQLSAVVEIDAQEYPIVDTNDPDRETGGHQFILKIAGGLTLVDTDDYNTLACIARTSEEKVNQSDIDGLYDVYWITNKNTGALGDKFNLYNASLGGELEGLIQMRDGNNSENFTGIVKAVSSTSEPAGSKNEGCKKITVAVTEDYLKDMDKCKLSNTGGVITLGNEEFYYTDWTYNRDASGNVTYDFWIDESKNNQVLSTIKINKEANIGQAIGYQGVPYYQEQLNEWVRIFSNAFNSILKDGYNVNGEPGVDLFVANHATDSDQYLFDGPAYKTFADDIDGVFTPTTGFTVSLNKDDDTYYMLTASNFDILTAVSSDADLLGTKRDQAAGTDAYDNVSRLVDLATNKKIASYRGAATQEFLTCVLSDVALNSKNAQVFKKNYTNIGNAIDNQRISISGVDNDDEAVSLIKYQNAYTMASKMIQTLTEVYDRLILETGV
jgi:flagellar hook-associated protein 1 FlgK